MSSVELTLSLALIIGLVYGIVAQISGFCLNSALRHQITQGNGNKLRAFMLALLIATIGTQAAQAAGLIDLSSSIYQASNVSWLLIGVGSVLFGFGMLRARGCGARALVLLGQGNLRSLVVLLCLGVSAFMTLTGVLGPLRNSINDMTTIDVSSFTFSSDTTRWLFVGLVAVAMLYFIGHDKRFRQSKADLIAGIVIGLLIISGWLTTGWLGFDEFEPTPVTSMTFVAPVGSTIQYAMIATGMNLSFGIVTVLAVIIGAFIAAKLTGQFKLSGFDRDTDMPRYIIGAICMGVGGALAMGCSIGQGLTGVSTLSVTSVYALLGICAGGWLALRVEASSLATAEPVK